MTVDPRDPHAEERRQARVHAYDEAMAELHRDDAPHLAAAAIANCPLCDADGYRGNRVCDHHDHLADTAHGRALVQAELEKIRQRKQGGAA